MPKQKPYKSENKIRETAWKAQYNLVTIHPFMDGNGRTSRLLMNYIEAYYGLNLTVILKKIRLDTFKLWKLSEKQDAYFTVMKKNKTRYIQTMETYKW